MQDRVAVSSGTDYPASNGVSGTSYPARLSTFQASLGQAILHGCHASLGQPILNGCELFKHLWDSLPCMAVGFSANFSSISGYPAWL